MSDATKATVVDIGEGTRRTGLEMILVRLATRMLSGRATFANGSPVVGAQVFLSTGIMASDVGPTDAGGRFEFEGFDGLRHTIRVSGRFSAEREFLLNDQSRPLSLIQSVARDVTKLWLRPV